MDPANWVCAPREAFGAIIRCGREAVTLGGTKPWRWVLLTAVLAGACESPGGGEPLTETSSEPTAVEGKRAHCERVTDGDTIVVRLNGQRERVRLIGIDTPETEHSPRGPQPFADEATAALRTLVGRKDVELRFDVERRDRYGRLLAYVHIDGIFVNTEMVRLGWARPLTVPPNVRHAEEIARLAQQARRQQKGIWSAE